MGYYYSDPYYHFQRWCTRLSSVIFPLRRIVFSTTTMLTHSHLINGLSILLPDTWHLKKTHREGTAAPHIPTSGLIIIHSKSTKLCSLRYLSSLVTIWAPPALLGYSYNLPTPASLETTHLRRQIRASESRVPVLRDLELQIRIDNLLSIRGLVE